MRNGGEEGVCFKAVGSAELLIASDLEADGGLLLRVWQSFGGFRGMTVSFYFKFLA